MRALIVETGRARGALAAARALHAAGWTVGVGTPTSGGMASASRATADRHRVPSPQNAPGDFVAALNAAIDERSYEVVFGAGDAEMLALSAHREELAAIVPYAPHDRVLRAVDKLTLTDAAAEVGLRTPDTAEATDANLGRWQPPYLVKASLHSRERGPDRLEASIVREPEAASRRAAEIRAAGSVPLLQELVPGRLMAYNTVSDREGRVVAGVLQVAAATWPPDAGISARAETAAPDPELSARVERLLAELGWFGLAQIQFVLPDDDEPRLIDLNGRFYGSLALAVAAGPNLPAIWAALATGRTPPTGGDPKPGLRYHWLEGDLRRAMAERRGGLVRDLLDSLRYSRGAVHTIWAGRDPWPSAQQLSRLPGRVLRQAGA